MSHHLVALPEDYQVLLQDLKSRIRQAQLRASVGINREMLLLYWGIATDMLARQLRQGWGTKVIDRLSVDLNTSFPDMKGLSARNPKYMRVFAAAWPDTSIVQEPLAQLTWYHNLT
jgi:hypothetical protein